MTDRPQSSTSSSVDSAASWIVVVGLVTVIIAELAVFAAMHRHTGQLQELAVSDCCEERASALRVLLTRGDPMRMTGSLVVRSRLRDCHEVAGVILLGLRHRPTDAPIRSQVEQAVNRGWGTEGAAYCALITGEWTNLEELSRLLQTSSALSN